MGGVKLRMAWHPAFTLVVLAATAITCAAVVFAGVAGGPVILARVLLFALPALVGMSAAAVVAREVGWGRLPGVPPAVTFVLGMALVVGAAMAAAGTWWAMRLTPAQGMWPTFDEVGMAPVAYCLFAAAAGSVFGALTVRVLPAALLTLGTFTGARLVVALVLRPRFRPSVLGPADSSTGAALPPDAWLQQTPAWAIVDRAGHQVTTLMAACSGPVAEPCPLALQVIHNAGLVQGAWYQPADRFWTFQGIEAAIFVALAMALAVLAGALLDRHQRQST